MDSTGNYRIEKDTLGEVLVPKNVFWGAQTQRVLDNFKISSYKFPKTFLKILLLIKKAAAIANKNLGVLDEEIAEGIIEAIDTILKDDKWDQFPLDIFQSGSGTQTNMNANEVISNLANQILGYELGKKFPVHPNDHVNKSQSSNDVISSALYLSVYVELKNSLIPVLESLVRVLEEKEKEFWEIVKVGRTHLQDAVPMTLGQEFSGYKAQIEQVKNVIEEFMDELLKIPLGGTAVGTGLNTHPNYSKEVTKELSKLIGENIRCSENFFADISAHDKIVLLSGMIRNLCISLMKIANDIRFLASGPQAGMAELILPKNEPGSSIMPGKVNPTQVESLIQVCLHVLGNDHSIALSGFYASQFQLNTAKPLMAFKSLENISLLSNSIDSFINKCLKGISPNLEILQKNVERSLMLATALAPVIGYDEAARIATKAYLENKTIEEVVVEEKILSKEDLQKYLSGERLAFPHDKAEN